MNEWCWREEVIGAKTNFWIKMENFSSSQNFDSLFRSRLSLMLDRQRKLQANAKAIEIFISAAKYSLSSIFFATFFSHRKLFSYYVDGLRQFPRIELKICSARNTRKVDLCETSPKMRRVIFVGVISHCIIRQLGGIWRHENKIITSLSHQHTPRRSIPWNYEWKPISGASRGDVWVSVKRMKNEETEKKKFVVFQTRRRREKKWSPVCL